jgi:hypothetical protein
VHIGAGHPGGLHRAVQRVGHLPYDALGATARGGELELADGRSGDVGDGGADAQRGDVEAGGVGGACVDAVQLGVGARPALGGAGGHDQTRGLQPGQQLGGGGLGEAGELPDPGPGQGAVLEQQIECGTVVHGTQYTRGTGGGSGHDGCTCLSTCTVRKVS